MDTVTLTLEDLPGLDCGLCGSRNCADLVDRIAVDPGLAKRCIYLDTEAFLSARTQSSPAAGTASSLAAPATPAATPSFSVGAAGAATVAAPAAPPAAPVFSLASAAPAQPVAPPAAPPATPAFSVASASAAPAQPAALTPTALPPTAPVAAPMFPVADTGSAAAPTALGPPIEVSCAGCAVDPASCGVLAAGEAVQAPSDVNWFDTLGREYDFVLEHFPEDPGPREIMLPHNPMLTRELDIQVGDVLIGRPLGMSCGCPITHCGVVMQVDPRTGVIVWCVTGPLRPRQEGYKDLGYYIAEGYEGLINHTKTEIEIGRRYFFQPQRCMLQWRHSGLVNYISRTASGLQVRVEGLWIG
jgi:uncharacterized Fe-S cluster-containing protein